MASIPGRIALLDRCELGFERADQLVTVRRQVLPGRRRLERIDRCDVVRQRVDELDLTEDEAPDVGAMAGGDVGERAAQREPALVALLDEPDGRRQARLEARVAVGRALAALERRS